ncbi:MAG: hypothetical protein ACXVC1_00865 [Tumebacillaceae bacterium]
MMVHDMKQRAEKWQSKQQRTKQAVLLSGLFVLAVIASCVWNVMEGDQVRWLLSIALAAGGLAVLVFSLSSYTNITLVAMYYNASYQYVTAAEDLDLVTGTLEEVSRLSIPYIGSLNHITLNVAGERIRYYCPSKLLQGLQPHERIRVRSHERFAIHVESTGYVDAPRAERMETTKLA